MFLPAAQDSTHLVLNNCTFAAVAPHLLQPPSGTFAALSCAGKAGVAVNDQGAIAACFGDAGYGAEGCATGTVVADAATSFWGGCKIAKATGALDCWGATTVYGTNSRPTLDECNGMSSSCGAVDILLVPPTGGFTTLACGGKRAVSEHVFQART